MSRIATLDGAGMDVFTSDPRLAAHMLANLFRYAMECLSHAPELCVQLITEGRNLIVPVEQVANIAGDDDMLSAGVFMALAVENPKDHKTFRKATAATASNNSSRCQTWN